MGVATGSRRDHVPCGQHVYQGGADGVIAGRIEFSAVEGWREYIGDVELRNELWFVFWGMKYGPVGLEGTPGQVLYFWLLKGIIINENAQ